MLIYDVGFINTDNKLDKTQVDIEESNREDVEIIELINLILSLKDEMGIKEIVSIDFVGRDDEEEWEE